MKIVDLTGEVGVLAAILGLAFSAVIGCSEWLGSRDQMSGHQVERIWSKSS